MTRRLTGQLAPCVFRLPARPRTRDRDALRALRAANAAEGLPVVVLRPAARGVRLSLAMPPGTRLTAYGREEVRKVLFAATAPRRRWKDVRSCWRTASSVVRVDEATMAALAVADLAQEYGESA
jgi:hypothetical protein